MFIKFKSNEPYTESELTYEYSILDNVFSIKFTPKISYDNCIKDGSQQFILFLKWYDEEGLLYCTDNIGYIYVDGSVKWYKQLTMTEYEILDADLTNGILTWRHNSERNNLGYIGCFVNRFFKNIEYHHELIDSKFKDAVIYHINDETKDIRDDVETINERIDELCAEGISLDTRIDKTVDVKIIEDINYNHSYDSTTGIITVIIDKDINIINLAEGHKNLVEMLWSAPTGSGLYGDIIDYQLLYNHDESYTFAWDDSTRNISLNNGVLKFEKSSNVPDGYILKELKLKVDNIVERIVTRDFKDKLFKDTVIDTIDKELDDKGIEERIANVENDIKSIDVVERLVDDLNYEEIIMYDTPIDITYMSNTFSYETHTYTITFTPAVGADNLKYGTKVLFGSISKKYHNGIAWSYQTRVITYTKIMNDDSYDLIWYSDDVEITGVTFKDGIWCDNGACFPTGTGSTNRVADMSLETNIYSDFEIIKQTTIRPCALRDLLVEFIYPIGSLYASYYNISPTERFGIGTWESIVLESTTVYAWRRLK